MKTALITGASAGIGQATAIELARQGIGVIVTYRSRRAEGEAIVATIEAAGGSAVALPLDIGDIAGLDGFVAQVVTALADTWGASHLDYLVNNAGAGGGAPFAEMTEDSFDAFHRILFKGPYFLTQKLLPVLADGGAVVNTGSSAALTQRVTAGYSAYAAMKGALHTVTPYWAKELADRGIRVNAIAPGTTRTRIGDDAFAKMPELADEVARSVALGRIGEPEDAAGVISFLLSDAARWVTGQVLEVSGGERL
ncbi:SDR family NAD(P)-dependent oxidoreductase [Nocardioides lijunqiniae]|uniref:SDR family NAD(P)-dependent oxidoreductase n=1 Tax=Nocardioides lijunqiniae TaxID=2760832 RepID=UPI001878435E|nr:SDR family oxidoreductase [Nocardioides lijunqiniae]